MRLKPKSDTSDLWLHMKVLALEQLCVIIPICFQLKFVSCKCDGVHCGALHGHSTCRPKSICECISDKKHNIVVQCTLHIINNKPLPCDGTGLTCAVESLVASSAMPSYYSSVESDSIEIKSNHCWCYRIRHEVNRLTALWVDLRFDFGSLPLRCRSISYGCGCKNIITSSNLSIPSFLSAWFIYAHCFDVLSSRPVFVYWTRSDKVPIMQY